MEVTATAERNHFFPAWVDGRESSLRDDYEAAHKRIEDSTDGRDLIEELFDVKDTLAELAKAGEIEAIGSIVVAVHRAYVQRITDRTIFGKPGAGCQQPKEAALEAMRNLVKDCAGVKNGLVRAYLAAKREKFE